MTPHQPYRRDAEEYGDQILSKAVKAGRRTYFFDVRATRGDDYFLTITESRKITAPDGTQDAEPRREFLVRPAQDFPLQGGFRQILRRAVRGRRFHPPQQARIFRAQARTRGRVTLPVESPTQKQVRDYGKFHNRAPVV